MAVDAPTWVPVALHLLRWAAKRPSQKLLQEIDPHQILELQNRRIDALTYMSGALRGGVRESAYAKIWKVQREHYLNVVEALVDKGMDPIVFKGVEHSSRYFQGRPLGILNDIDILVPRSSIASARRLLFSMGYVQGAFDGLQGELIEHDFIKTNQQEHSHYELMPFEKLITVDLSDEEQSFLSTWGTDRISFQRDVSEAELQEVQKWGRHPIWRFKEKLVLSIRIDLHFQVALDIPSEPLFSRAKPSSTGMGLTFCDTDHLWFTVSRYYTEVALHNQRSLRDLAYLAPMICEGKISWDLLSKIADEYSIESSLYYYLTFLSELTGSAHASGNLVPEGFLRSLRASRSPIMRDWGWQLNSLFDLTERNSPLSSILVA